jgi:hypothetical protein
MAGVITMTFIQNGKSFHRTGRSSLVVDTPDRSQRQRQYNGDTAEVSP